MRIKTISATYTQKFNLGNYENCELSTFVAAEVDEDDENIDLAIQLLYEYAKKGVITEAQKIVKLHDVYNPTVAYYAKNRKVETKGMERKEDEDIEHGGGADIHNLYDEYPEDIGF